MEVDLNALTDEQLEKALKERQNAKKKEAEEKKKAYEEKRNGIANALGFEAQRLAEQIEDFHKRAVSWMQGFKEEAREYGGVPKNSRGGFSIANDHFKVSLRFHALWDFDERAKMAEELLHEFLRTTVKKRDLALHDLLCELLQRNRDGMLEPRRVMELVKHETKFDDPNWKQAIVLLKESYQERGSKYYLDFSAKNELGKWEPIDLNFSAH